MAGFHRQATPKTFASVATSFSDIADLDLIRSDATVSGELRKAAQHGIFVVVVHRRFSSNKTCSTCEHHGPRMSQSVRECG